MAYIDDLISNGTNFEVQRKRGSASFRPVTSSDADLDAFQSVVRELRANDGAGYRVHLEHEVSDRGGELVDLVLVTLDDS